MNWRLGTLIVTLVGVIAAQDGGDETDNTKIMGTEEQRARGRVLYDKHCLGCHGENGEGLGPAENVFDPKPRDFTLGMYKIRTTPNGEIPRHEDIVHITKVGMPYTGMPPWPNLSEKELSDISYYLKSFAEFDFTYSPEPPDPVPLRELPDFSRESVEKGRDIYLANNCHDCHGESGRGSGPSAPTQTDDWGNFLRPADLTKNWQFIGGNTRHDIYRTLATGLNGTPMPSFPDLLNSDSIVYLVDYVYSLSEQEPGYRLAFQADLTPAAGDKVDSLLMNDKGGARFPLVAQMIEKERVFSQAVTDVELQAVYDSLDLVVRVSWNDMSADTVGVNTPDPSVSALPNPLHAAPAVIDTTDTLMAADTSIEAQVANRIDGPGFADAIAIQIPLEKPHGESKPYFIFGDPSAAVEVWYMDMGSRTPRVFTARGAGMFEEMEAAGFTAKTNYQNGRWTVVFRRPMSPEWGAHWEPGEFVPIAFSAWDGFQEETETRHGLSQWYHLQIKPPQTSEGILKAGASILGLLFIEILLVLWIRRRNKAEVSK